MKKGTLPIVSSQVEVNYMSVWFYVSCGNYSTFVDIFVAYTVTQ